MSEDLSDFQFFRPKTNDYIDSAEFKEEVPGVVEAHTVGAKVVDPESPHAYAKKVTKNGVNKYYAKVGTSGLDSGHLFDPWSNRHAGTSTVAERKSAVKGKKRFEWRSINKDAYEMYISYLRTKNATRLRNAERQM